MNDSMTYLELCLTSVSCGPILSLSNVHDSLALR